MKTPKFLFFADVNNVLFTVAYGYVSLVMKLSTCLLLLLTSTLGPLIY